MTEKLTELIEQARSHQMTEEEKARQRISFAYGNVHLSNPNVTREMVEEADRRLHPSD